MRRKGGGRRAVAETDPALVPALERLVCHITQNWRGRPLTDRVAVVELIGATTTKAGLKVQCALDERTYEKGIKVSDAEMQTLDITASTNEPRTYTKKKNTIGIDVVREQV